MLSAANKTLPAVAPSPPATEATPWPPDLRSLLFIGLGILGLEMLLLALLFEVPASLGQNLGPLWPFLIGLSAAALGAIGLLTWGRVTQAGPPPPFALEILTLAESLGPALGLLGTFLALYQLLTTLDPQLPTRDIIALLTKRGGEAYGSSVVGIGIQVVCYAARWVFDRSRS